MVRETAASWWIPSVGGGGRIPLSPPGGRSASATAYPVSTRVNRPANDDPGLIEPESDARGNRGEPSRRCAAMLSRPWVRPGTARKARPCHRSACAALPSEPDRSLSLASGPLIGAARSVLGVTRHLQRVVETWSAPSIANWLRDANLRSKCICRRTAARPASTHE